MPGIVKLFLNMNKSKPIRHPLLNDAKKKSKQEINSAAQLKLLDPASDELFFALRSCVRNIVGRFIYYYPGTENFLDDMVSESFSVISEFVSKITLDTIINYDILNIVHKRIRNRLENYLNKNQHIVTSSMRTHHNKFKKGEEAIYYDSFDLSGIAEQPLDDGDEWKRDLLDSLNHIAENHVDDYILRQENWGRTYQSLADELKVGVGTICRRKALLYDKYLELSR